MVNSGYVQELIAYLIDNSKPLPWQSVLKKLTINFVKFPKVKHQNTSFHRIRRFELKSFQPGEQNLM